jgi:hypothetical protein
MGNDLFVMMNHNKYEDVKNFVERRVSIMVMDRHNYPMWPSHGESPSDRFEEDFHGRSRGVYYEATRDLIQVLRKLRNIS